MGRNITVSVGDMDMGMDTATDMAIAVGDFRGLRPPPLFKNFSSVRDVRAPDIYWSYLIRAVNSSPRSGEVTYDVSGPLDAGESLRRLA